MIKIIHKNHLHSLLLNLKAHITPPNEERFLRFLDFQAKYLSQVPYIFKPLSPAINYIKQAIMNLNSFVGMPWWLALVLSAFVIRIGIFPLILLQMKRVSKIGPIAPVLVHVKEGWKHSSLPFWKKLLSALKIYRVVSKQQKFRLMSIFVYNLAYYPLLITMIYSIRSVLAQPQLASATFLHLNTLTDIDPYYILPTLTVAIYYYNFQRFITPENRHTLLSKIRSLCQFLLILWFPFLCCWPSGIVVYMMTNALLSVLQTNLMKSQWFLNKINQKILHYNIMLNNVQYDKGTSQSIIQAIKTGEESIKEKGIKEEILIQQTQKMIQKLNKERQEPSENDGNQEPENKELEKKENK